MDVATIVFDIWKECSLPLSKSLRNLSARAITIGTYPENGGTVLSVQDTGTGISEEVLGRLGTPFVTTKATGTGLGLSVCYRIAERHDAKIEFKSSPQGTTFLVKFKACKVEN